MFEHLKTQHKAPATTAPASEPPTGLERVLNIETELGGQVRRATVTARVMDMSAKIARDRLAAELAAPSRFDDLPAAAQLRIWATATLAYSLTDAPAWLSEWAGLYDPLLFALFEEVSAHERAFFRGHLEAGADTAKEPRVEIKRLTLPAL
jgi:hypothetical protein